MEEDIAGKKYLQRQKSPDWTEYSFRELDILKSNTKVDLRY
jgi:hypothetical protein